MATAVRFFEVTDRNGDVLYHSRQRRVSSRETPRRLPSVKSSRHHQPEIVVEKKPDASLAVVVFIIVLMALVTLVW